MYVKGRINWLLGTFKDQVCPYCGEVESVCLEWYPYHKQIRNLIFRNSAKSEQRQEALKLIEQSSVLCHNCVAKQLNDLGVPNF